jgi:hypothetical protein
MTREWTLSLIFIVLAFGGYSIGEIIQFDKLNIESGIEFKRVLQFELPDKTIIKITLNGTDNGYYDLFESSINYFGEKLMLKDLKLLSDDFIKFNKTDGSKIEVVLFD